MLSQAQIALRRLPVVVPSDDLILFIDTVDTNICARVRAILHEVANIVQVLSMRVHLIAHRAFIDNLVELFLSDTLQLLLIR